jgi:hypothetical protein
LRRASHHMINHRYSHRKVRDAHGAMFLQRFCLLACSWSDKKVVSGSGESVMPKRDSVGRWSFVLGSSAFYLSAGARISVRPCLLRALLRIQRRFRSPPPFTMSGRATTI